jgi:penicillin-binding protein 1A
MKVREAHFLVRWTRKLSLILLGLWAFFLFILIVTSIGLWFWIASQLPVLQTLLSTPLPTCKTALPGPTIALPRWRVDAFASIESPDGMNPYGTPTMRLIGSVVLAPVYFVFGNKWPPRNSATMLLARGLADGSDRTLSMHFKQLVLSDIIETELSEEEVAKELLARMYFGKGANGLDCAAMVRYNATVEKLTLGQFAMLIGLLKAPTNYDPEKHPETALQRRNAVLNIWLEKGIATPEDVERAKAEPI